VIKDEIGKRFGRWLVLRRGDGPGKWKTYWLCRCDCGEEKSVPATHLRSGASTSCGCVGHARKHGQSGGTKGTVRSAEYETWHLMIQRCSNPKASGYENYGGRGIAVCQRWLESFEAFLVDMGPKPTPKHSIEREKNDLGYEPGNCHWATSKEQGRNKRSTKLSETKAADIRLRVSNGERPKDLATEFGVHGSVVSRVARGLSWA
jgi:hypothetical protein